MVSAELPMRPTGLLVCASVLCGVLSLAAGAGAAPTWRPAERISPADGGPPISSAQVAVSAGGGAVVVWERAGVAQAIGRAGRSEAWTAPVDLSAGGSPIVDVEEDGGAVVAYTKGGFPSRTAQAVSRESRFASWKEPVTLSPRPYVEALDVAVNAAGDAVVGLTSFSGAGYVTEAAYRGAFASTWEPAVQLSDPNGNALGTRVAIDENGNAAAVWVQAGPTGTEAIVRAASRPAASGVWTTPVTLAGPFREAEPTVAMDRNGNAVAAWTAIRTDGGSVAESVEASVHPAGGGWTAPVAVSAPAYIVSDLQLAFDPVGRFALAAWVQVRAGQPTHVQAASLTMGSAAWQQPVDVTAPEPGRHVSGLDLALDPAGNAVAAWAGGPVAAALRPAASGAWGAPIDVAAPAGGTSTVEVALDGKGNGLAVWGTTTTPAMVEASELDGAGPVFGRVDVPPTATARVPVTLSAEAVPWADAIVGTPRWSFGDGASAEGTTVQHVYAGPGTYGVSVTQADAGGGSSTVSRTIAVEAPTLANTARPTIRGRARVGATLACLPGRWSGTAPIRFGYTWFRNGRRVSSGARRRLVARDAGSLMACTVRATNPAGSRAATSRPVRVRR
jgi:hypothetical protein